MSNLTPTDIKLLQKQRTLHIIFDNGEQFTYSCEFLRVHSPSAEVRGHGKPVLVTAKQDVNIIGIEPVGHYAIKITFDDGHNSGLYSWDYLYDLGKNYAKYSQAYAEKIATTK